MTKRKAEAKTGKKRASKPPVEHQFKPGNKAAVGHGRPRTISELRERIQELSEENVQGYKDLTRLDLLLRGMFASRNATDRNTLLKYGWGNVPDEMTLKGDAESPVKILVEYVDTPTTTAPAPGATDDQSASEAV